MLLIEFRTTGVRMSLLLMLRHGESVWNKKNIFTGWVDVPLSEKGVTESIEAGKEIGNTPIDVLYCSTLIRGIMTGILALTYSKNQKTPVIMHTEGLLNKWGTIYSEEEKKEIIPVHCSDALNERMYGELQGLNKQKTMDKFGKEQVQIWRRSYRTSPPNGESLEMTLNRALPYFKNTIIPELARGKNVFIAAHGNSLRAITKYLDNLSDEEILHFEIPTGVLMRYEYSNGTFNKI